MWHHVTSRSTLGTPTLKAGPCAYTLLSNTALKMYPNNVYHNVISITCIISVIIFKKIEIKCEVNL